MMKISFIFSEITSMLYWTMLAACTVGPGTVVTCARAGAEYDLSLIWALVFASVLAYTLQEGTARLTIVSGKSLGQCLRVKYRHGARLYDTALVCWLVGISVFFGNTLYECNNWAGGIDAILAIPGTENTTELRVACCLGYALVVLALLYWDKVDMLGIFLGIMMICMVLLFLVVVGIMGLDFKELFMGLIPNIPEKKSELSAEPSDIILSLVGTTSIGFNLFMGGSMAKGKKLEAAQRGIAFSTISALKVSILILIVGAETFDDSNQKAFTIQSLASLIENIIGEIGVFVFSIGFVAAALSSMLAVPLGAGLTAQSVFSDEPEEVTAEKPVTAAPTVVVVNADGGVDACGGDGGQEQEEAGQPEKLQDSVKMESERLVNTQEKDQEGGNSGDEKLGKEGATRLVNSDGDNKLLEEAEAGLVGGKMMPRYVYWGIISSMVVIATCVISLNAPRVHVILVAQVFNGCLLPFFSICLMLCLNDQQFMSSQPQKAWSNCFLIVSVTITLFLATNVFIQKVFGAFLTGVWLKMGVAAGVALVVMAGLGIFTSLGRDLARSFRKAE